MGGDLIPAHIKNINMKNYIETAKQLIADLKTKDEALKYCDKMMKVIDQTMTDWKHANAYKFWLNVKSQIEMI